ncbi:hypothetical protein L2E82_30833 [Cichorium intybus]|uniref:Uncharacterized protein n=1 Tax=Cichorium intybus TaxID=13427 RepID=A0ACB9D1G0_CICIN|nr:hypothetical protein L2E82_30833 [Cichorium intybus]
MTTIVNVMSLCYDIYTHQRCLVYQIATIAFLCRLLPSSTSPTLIVFFIPHYHNLQSSPPSEETPPQAHPFPERRPSRVVSDDAGWELDESIQPAALRETIEEAGLLGTVELSTTRNAWYGGMGTLLVIKVSAESASEFGESVADSVTKELLHYIEKPETFDIHINHEDRVSFNMTPAKDFVRLDQDILSPLAVKKQLYTYETMDFWEQIKTPSPTATSLANRHVDGSMPIDDFNLEFENQSGEKVQLGSENDQRYEL